MWQKLLHIACFGPNECNGRLAELRHAACINQTSSEVSFLAMQWASLSSVHAYEKKFWKIVINLVRIESLFYVHSKGRILICDSKGGSSLAVFFNMILSLDLEEGPLRPVRLVL